MRNPAAAQTAWATRGVQVPSVRSCRLGSRTQEQTAERQFLSASAVGEKSELPDAHKSCGQDVQQETPDELRCLQCHDLGFVALCVVFVLEADAAILQR